jgi:hypothetical protein
LNKIRIKKNFKELHQKKSHTCKNHMFKACNCMFRMSMDCPTLYHNSPNKNTLMFCLSKHLIHRLNILIFGIHIHQGSPKSSSHLETIISNIFIHSQSSFKGINLFTSRKSKNDGENIQPYPFSNILKNMDNVF